MTRGSDVTCSRVMQGVILALEALVAAGSQMVGTSQGGRMDATRHEALRDDDTKAMLDEPAFEQYLKGVRKGGEWTLHSLSAVCCYVGASKLI